MIKQGRPAAVQDGGMKVQELMAKLGDNISVRRVFGEPVERDGTTIIPVGMVMGGGGGGGDNAEDGGGGGGFGVWSRGLGVYTVRDGEVRYVPAVDAVVLGVVALLVAGRLLGKLIARRRP
jgi:uncharacterized spore protein YtfJ